MDLPRSLFAILGSPAIWLALAGGSVLYMITIVVYRLRFHPLSKFPGPKIAAATGMYEMYHDLIRGGQYTFVLGDLHTRYGPIVRISPWELHIDDPEFYEVLYSGSSNPREKWDRFSDLFDIPTAFFSTAKSDLHRKRRAPFEHMFSKRSIVKLSPLVIGHVQKLSRRLEESRGSGKPVNWRYATSALALDIVTDYAFSVPYGLLDEPDFGRKWPDSVDQLMENGYINLYMPWVNKLMRMLPISVVRVLAPDLLLVIAYQINLRDQIVEIMKNPTDPKYNTAERPTIFHEALNSPELPAGDRTLEHFMQEAQVIITAGVVTTAHHLNVTFFHLMSNPDIIRLLKQELEDAMPDSNVFPPLQKLEELEYLSAVITEGHRMTYGVSHRMARISPKLPIQYQDWTIPPGHPVSMSNVLMHDNPILFPEPRKFDPSRYLGPEGRKLKKYIVPFSKGTRSCIGQTLAQAELAFTIAGVVRRFDFKLHETTVDEVTMRRDMFTPLPCPNVRLIVE